MTVEFMGSPFANLLARMQEQYPQYVALLRYEPQIFHIFEQAYNDPASWPPERITAAVMSTPYFLNTPAPVRQFHLVSALDPATARLSVQEMDLVVRRAQAQLGVLLDPTDALLLTLNAASQGWDETRVRQAVVAMGKGAGWLQAGQIGALMTEFNGVAAEYGVPLHGDDLYWWAANVAVGNQTLEGFQQHIVNQAIQLFPAIASKLAEGITTAQYAAPYFALAAQELGINPNQISLRDPKWLDLFLGDTEKGEPGVLSMKEALVKLRTDPAYGYDSGLPALTESARLTTMIAEKMGVVG